eukprot:TRINITY_DN108225_c0_g1_i3.p3 TRINITY_DN108225_c0_g1~~TRINITY_DN108225_c0_g1_i3.p3  ORF type:complete len:190 (-),score=41.50 TRINITY_DN108225_c0_g1_i3:29-598(-)
MASCNPSEMEAGPSETAIPSLVGPTDASAFLDFEDIFNMSSSDSDSSDSELSLSSLDSEDQTMDMSFSDDWEAADTEQALLSWDRAEQSETVTVPESPAMKLEKEMRDLERQHRQALEHADEIGLEMNELNLLLEDAVQLQDRALFSSMRDMLDTYTAMREGFVLDAAEKKKAIRTALFRQGCEAENDD